MVNQTKEYSAEKISVLKGLGQLEKDQPCILEMLEKEVYII